MGETEDEHTARASQLFETFVQASTCKGTLQAFSILCRQLELDPLDHGHFYHCLKAAVTSWKVKALWTKLDKRAQHKAYEQNTACQGTRCLIIGGGPCGLRTAIELALLGCKVVVIEKRDTFSRNNVLHLWPYTIHDLRGLGAKKFYGKFCAGSIDHISIRQLQLMLLKVSLILGIEVHINVEFVKLLEPPEEQTDDSPGWRAEVRPATHPVSEFDFDVVIGADGRRNTLDGFSRKEFRGKLAIAITANFVNRNTTAEAKVEEISGVAFIFNQKFFLELKEDTGIDLENIVYYRDNTHYFVMTAKKQSLLDKGVILNDYLETERLLSPDNVDQEALRSYAREAADFGTNYQLPSLDYAINHYGQPDVAMFDFTSMYASENAALIREKHGHQLMVALVGDSLLEPFWPMGTGCARGFLAAFDAAWMVKGWAQGRNPLEVLAERESIYRLLPQTTPENLSKNFDQYTIDPSTRYPNLNSTCVRPHQVRHLFFDGKQGSGLQERGPIRQSVNLSRRESDVRPSRLLTWCQKQTQGYRGVEVTNLTSSWKSGLALCALIHRQKPDIIDFDCLNEEDVAENNQLAFDVAEREFKIQPVTTGKEMAAEGEPDKLLMVLYLSKFYEAFRSSPLNSKGSRELDENTKDYATNNNQPRKRIPREDKKPEDDSVNKRRRKGDHYLSELSCHSAPPPGENEELRENKVRSMATLLLAKFEENSTTGKIRTKSDEDLSHLPGSPSPVSSPLPLSSEDGEEEEEQDIDNPRFAKPKPAPPPPSRPKWQPSIYLRLLENPNASVCPSRSPSPPRCRSPVALSCSPTSPLNELSECPGSPLAPNHWCTVGLSHVGSDESEQQSKGPTLSTQEFTKRSIQERAVHLSSLFSGSSKPPTTSVSENKDRISASSFSSPAPPSVPKLKYPTVHPVPDPTAQAGFSSAPSTTAATFENMALKKSSSHQSYAPVQAAHSAATISKEKCPNRQFTSTPLPNLNCENGHDSTLCLPSSPIEHNQNPGTEDLLGGNDSTKCHVSSKRPIQQSFVRSESCPATAPSYLKERTIGKVSSAIDAKAQKLAIMYETDHRPNAAPCVSRRGFAPSLGGSDTCHFCSKRVYVMERLSADGHFFHRDCFRCDVCNCVLRLGTHTYDSREGKFYCKVHYAQHLTSSIFGKFGRRTDDQSQDKSQACTAASSDAVAGGEPEAQTVVTETDAEMAVEALEASCLVTTSNELTEAKATSQDQSNAKQTHRWKRKIQATFPLIFVKHFQRSWSGDKPGPETVPEAESHFEDITPIDSHDVLPECLKTDTQCPSDGKEEREKYFAKTKAGDCAPAPKKRLTIPVCEKEKLLDWEVVTTEEASRQMNRSEPKTEEQDEQVQTHAVGDKAQIDPVQDPAQSQNSSSSVFQLIASAFRKNRPSSPNTTVTMRQKRDGSRRQRPMSEGAFNFSSLFSAAEWGSDKNKASSEVPSVSSDPWGAGRDLPSLLQQVSLKSRRVSELPVPRRRVDLFSSLRLRKRQGSENEEIRTILTNLRNKASSQQSLHELSSEDENDNSVFTNKWHPDRQRKNQEKTQAQQAKRDQLKRLHRAQTIQRQLEEVGEKQRDLEERGVAIEKLIRGETEKSHSDDRDEAQLYQTWFKLVLEKNRLARYESELMIFAQELELEDTQSRLQQELRKRMAVEDTKKSASELQQEQEMLAEIMRTVERRDELVCALEEQRLRERAEDRDLESLLLSRGYEFHWAHLDDGEELDQGGECLMREGGCPVATLGTTLV
ncbi:F-actin-monooxygenase mical2b isoform X2 [Periophthalmus magnuspinnatus]|uniref:F-actin-monooxygenase mical2b isoform X2 n=1 Tax=Periophthalmus magnuspinnatus TaxID=409849 RepID=UPI0024364BEF|nr:F-actin-monooxygenase mical2b isoform X2 [Periophthalmus magnuspinnatus]